MNTDPIEFMKEQLKLQMSQSTPNLEAVMKILQTLALGRLAMCVTMHTDEAGAVWYEINVSS